MKSNRYLSHKFSGHPIKARLKLIYWRLFRRPHAKQLGSDSYLMPNFKCSAPKRMSIGRRVLVGRGARFDLLTSYLGQSFEPRLVIGDDVYVGLDCEMVCIDRIEIGQGCVFSDNIYINDSSHGMDPSETLIMDRPLISKGPVKIGAGCFVGRGVTILSGVTVGENCVIGAGAVVTRSIPAYSMASGNPARVVSRFDMETRAWVRVI